MQATSTASWAGFVPKKQTMRPPPVLRDGVVSFPIIHSTYKTIR